HTGEHGFVRLDPQSRVLSLHTTARDPDPAVASDDRVGRISAVQRGHRVGGTLSVGLAVARRTQTDVALDGRLRRTAGRYGTAAAAPEAGASTRPGRDMVLRAQPRNGDRGRIRAAALLRSA